MTSSVVLQVYPGIFEFDPLDPEFFFKNAPIGNLGIERTGIDHSISIAIGHIETLEVNIPEKIPAKAFYLDFSTEFFGQVADCHPGYIILHSRDTQAQGDTTA